MDFDENEKHTTEIYNDEVKYKSQSIEFNITIYDINNEQKKTDNVINAITDSKIYYLVFDVNKKETFDHINYWIEVIKRCKASKKDKNKYLIAIIGNKTDLNKSNDINNIMEEAKNFAKENQGIFLMTSALNNEGIDSVILESVENYLSLQYN